MDGMTLKEALGLARCALDMERDRCDRLATETRMKGHTGQAAYWERESLRVQAAYAMLWYPLGQDS